MLPDYLVSPRYRNVDESENQQGAARQGDLQTEQLPDNAQQAVDTVSALQKNQSVQDYEAQILAGYSWAGQSSNSLLEEQDRHIKERIFCAAKIETYVSVLEDLCRCDMIDAQELRQLIDEMQAQVASKGNDIWLNLLTREKAAPLFYHFEDKSL